MNIGLVALWAVISPAELFWPLFSILGWGIGLGAHAWYTYARDPLTPERIQREMDSLRR